jgi:hypothetical protein
MHLFVHILLHVYLYIHMYIFIYIYTYIRDYVGEMPWVSIPFNMSHIKEELGTKCEVSICIKILHTFTYEFIYLNLHVYIIYMNILVHKYMFIY